MNDRDAREGDDAELQRDPRPPFHPLRAVDAFRENFKQWMLLVPLIYGTAIVGWVVPEWVARTGLMLLIGHYIIALMPRATLYGNDLGTWPSGELYDRLIRSDSDVE